MELHEDLTKLSETLKQQRDEIRLQIHLATADLKDDWEESEKEWGHFKDKFAEIIDESKETTAEFLEKTRVVGEELKLAYKNIHRRLSS
jgi:nucleoid-associated protein YejK